jgi:hypothetical protein
MLEQILDTSPNSAKIKLFVERTHTIEMLSASQFVLWFTFIQQDIPGIDG